MNVTAAEGLEVPRSEAGLPPIQHNPKKPVTVPDNSYYRRRIASGELVLITPPVSVPVSDSDDAKQPAKKGKKEQQHDDQL